MNTPFSITALGPYAVACSNMLRALVVALLLPGCTLSEEGLMGGGETSADTDLQANEPDDDGPAPSKGRVEPGPSEPKPDAQAPDAGPDATPRPDAMPAKLDTAPPPLAEPITLAAGSFDGSHGDIGTYQAVGIPSISHIEEGDWLRFDDVDFGSDCSFDTFETMVTTPHERNRVMVHLDDIASPPIAELVLAKTSKAFEETDMMVQKSKLESATGRHNVFIVFAGPSAPNSDWAWGIGNFRYFRFADEKGQPSCR